MSTYNTPQAKTYAGPSVMAPLHDAVFCMQFLAWFNIIGGIIYACSITGLIFAWMPIWIGICAKNAADSLKVAQASGDPQQYRKAAENISTIFKICGITAMVSAGIFAVMILIGLIFLLFMLIASLGLAGAAASQ